MRGIHITAMFLIVASAAGTPSTEAAIITQTLGTANYANGQTVGTGTFASNPSGDPAPFDRLIGNKTTGPNPSASFAFASYGGPIASPSSAFTTGPRRPRAPRFSSLP